MATLLYGEPPKSPKLAIKSGGSDVIMPLTCSYRVKFSQTTVCFSPDLGPNLPS
jgi:hypothetical protein